MHQQARQCRYPAAGAIDTAFLRDFVVSMDAMTAITTRRSVRKFTDQSVDFRLLEELVAAASCAPSAGNARPWSFVIVDRREVLDAAERVNPYATAARGAPCGILVCGMPEKEKHRGFWVQDCAACTTTLLLAAHARGLGTCWTGVYPIRDRVESFRRMAALPVDVTPFSLVLIGYTDRRATEAPDRTGGGSLFYNIWGHREIP